MRTKMMIAAAALMMLCIPVASMATVTCVCGDDGTPDDGVGVCDVSTDLDGGITQRAMQFLTDATITSDNCTAGMTICQVEITGDGGGMPTSEYTERFRDEESLADCALGPGDPLPVELVEASVE